MYTGGDFMESLRIQIRLPKEILEELDKMAQERGLNRSAMVRLLIREKQRDGAGTTTRPIEDQ